MTTRVSRQALRWLPATIASAALGIGAPSCSSGGGGRAVPGYTGGGDGSGGDASVGCEPGCPAGTVCDTLTQRCVQCVANSDCPNGQVCGANVCGIQPACASS